MKFIGICNTFWHRDYHRTDINLQPLRKQNKIGGKFNKLLLSGLFNLFKF